MKKFKRCWRKNGTMISSLFILAVFFLPNPVGGILVGVGLFAMMTTPCNSKFWNKSKLHWFFRQFLLFLVGAFNVGIQLY